MSKNQTIINFLDRETLDLVYQMRFNKFDANTAYHCNRVAQRLEDEKQIKIVWEKKK